MLRLENRFGKITISALASISNRTFHSYGRCGCFAAAAKNRTRAR
jgi:hypothetical protein